MQSQSQNKLSRTRSPVAARRHARRVRLLDGRAHRMRSHPEPAEQLLWEQLKGKQLGVAFRRQLVIGQRFIVDFAAPKARLIVEVDGLYHARQRTADARRERWLRRQGWRILRLPEQLVRRELSVAVARVAAALWEQPG